MTGMTKISHNASRKTAGTGYVILNNVQPRVNYIRSCFKNQTINIITNDGEIIPNCLVAKGVWNHLNFPEDIKTRGSAIVWINIPYLERVIVINVLNKRDEVLENDNENTFKFQRKIDENNVVFSGDGKQGVFNFLTQGEEAGESQIVYKLLSGNQQALMDIYVQGNIKYNVENDVDFRVGDAITIVVRDDENPGKSAKLTYKLGEGFTLQDEFSNQVRTNNNGVFAEVPANKKVYAVASGSTGEPALLGDATALLLQTNINLLDQLIKTLDAATKANSGPIQQSAVSPVIPLLKANLSNMKNQFTKIKATNLNIT